MLLLSLLLFLALAATSRRVPATGARRRRRRDDGGTNIRNSLTVSVMRAAPSAGDPFIFPQTRPSQISRRCCCCCCAAARVHSHQDANFKVGTGKQSNYRAAATAHQLPVDAAGEAEAGANNFGKLRLIKKSGLSPTPGGKKKKEDGHRNGCA